MRLPKGFVESNEGGTRLVVPEASMGPGPPSRVPVFFNPRGRVARDFAVLACRVEAKERGAQSFGEPLGGIGVKSVRCLVEVRELGRCYSNDSNPLGARISALSARTNRVAGRLTGTSLPAWRFLGEHSTRGQRFSFVDVDPFGTPTEFVEPSIQALDDGGILALTATDTAPLSGLYGVVSFRKYFGRSLRTDYSRELALRLLVSMAMRRAMSQDAVLTPVFVHSDQHYMRAYLRFERGARWANEAAAGFGHVLHCFSCAHRQTSDLPRATCPSCGREMKGAGLMWLGRLIDRGFVASMARYAVEPWMKGHARLLARAGEELDSPPYFFRLPDISDGMGVVSSSPRDIAAELNRGGWKATLTSLDGQGVRSDAPIQDVKDAIRRCASR